MNKEKSRDAGVFRRKLAISLGGATLALTLVACTGDTYEYAVSGVVEAGQIDYDCPRSLSMEPAGFVTGKHGRTKSPRSTTRRSGSSTGSRSRTRSSTPVSKGVKLKKKPDSAERVSKVPTPKYRSKPRGCKVDDYELFIRSNGSLYEQDVRKVDYDKCLATKSARFPRCTAK